MTQAHGSSLSSLFKLHCHETKPSSSVLPLPICRSLLPLVNSAHSSAAVGVHPVTWQSKLGIRSGSKPANFKKSFAVIFFRNDLHQPSLLYTCAAGWRGSVGCLLLMHQALVDLQHYLMDPRLNTEPVRAMEV